MQTICEISARGAKHLCEPHFKKGGAVLVEGKTWVEKTKLFKMARVPGQTL